MKFIQGLNKFGLGIGNMIPDWVLSLSARIAIFMVFWPSAQTKITGVEFLGQSFAFWNVTDITYTLFENEYAIPLLPADLAAYLATFGEFFFALFMLFGLFTRISALGLLGITLVIQVFVYPETWVTHLLWGVILVYLLKKGGGAISLDDALLR